MMWFGGKWRSLPNKLELAWTFHQIARMARGPLASISIKAISKLDAFGKVSGSNDLLVCCPDVAATDFGRCQSTDEDGSPT